MAAKSWDDLCEGFCPGGGQLATFYTFGHFQHKHLHQQAAASQAGTNGIQMNHLV